MNQRTSTHSLLAARLRCLRVCSSTGGGRICACGLVGSGVSTLRDQYAVSETTGRGERDETASSILTAGALRTRRESTRNLYGAGRRRCEDTVLRDRDGTTRERLACASRVDERGSDLG